MSERLNNIYKQLQETLDKGQISIEYFNNLIADVIKDEQRNGVSYVDEGLNPSIQKI